MSIKMIGQSFHEVINFVAQYLALTKKRQMTAIARQLHRAFTFSEGFHTPTTAPNAAAPIKQIIIL
jgi:hypothetical protein